MEYLNWSGNRAYREQPQDLAEYSFEQPRKWLNIAMHIIFIGATIVCFIF